EARLTPDGRFVAFLSSATNLVAGDVNGYSDVFVHDRTTGFTDIASVDPVGAQANQNALECISISADGRFVAFWSDATNLVAGDTNGFADVFVHDRQTGGTERVSVGPLGVQGDSWSA